jgi:dienelactone hydrolase
MVLIIVMLPLYACTRETPPTTTPSTTTPPGTLQEKAKAWVNLLVEGKFDVAVTSFDKAVAAQMSAGRLEETWDALLDQVSGFKDIVNTRTDTQSGYNRVFVTCNFEKADIDVLVVYDAEEKIAGLFFQPSSASAGYEAPGYADPSRFTETGVAVGTGQKSLPGTLTMPKGAGPFPAVVLVHGSGGNNRDEAVGANRPFQDLAWGLASRDIAVLRYDKRTKVYPQDFTDKIDSFTIQDEVITDVIAAVDLLGKTERIDGDRIFILGHSLGGMLTPRIAAQESRLAGIVILAGPTRKLEDLILEQYNYLASLDGVTDENEAAQIKAVEALVGKIKESDIGTGESVLGAGRAYWEDLEKYDQVATAKNLDLPMLILQGERDYQVTMVDFQAWSDALQGRDNVTLKSYAGLNHLFISGSGQPSPAEYEKPGNVALDVIEDIVTWINNRS